MTVFFNISRLIIIETRRQLLTIYSCFINITLISTENKNIMNDFSQLTDVVKILISKVLKVNAISSSLEKEIQLVILT